ncbi:hypothetical protein LCGC14_0405910 [marine sediment metagenome]|uniref:LamG-like jellyroll fold domain-containing protein n=1 Tax=marine sediment metagenome TaxID=412755 RepID=A0A0F9TDD0_9ZZZZ
MTEYAKSLWSYNPIPNGCKLYLPLWSPSLRGSAFKSVDSFGHAVTVVGCIQENDSRDFDGDDHIIVGDTSTFRFMHGTPNTTGFTWTLSWWMKLDNPDPSTLYALFSNNRGGANVGINIYYRDDGAENRRFHLSIKGDPGVIVGDFSDVVAYPADSNYHFCRITWNQAPVNTNGEFFVDEVSKGNVDKTRDDGGTGNANDPLYIGVLSDAVNFDLVGNISEVWIHDYVLSTAQGLYLKNKSYTQHKFV